MARKLALGIDYGSLSGRALLVDIASGEELGSFVHPYKHGFIEDTLPATGEKLPLNWTLQDPQDYLEALEIIIPGVLQTTGAKPEEIVGIGVDFTASTVLPIKDDGTPLCFLPEFKNNKHAYVKKWKHHAAQKYADRMNVVAQERGEAFLQRYGGKINSEWLFPKLWQTLDEAPEVYAAMDHFVEAADWLVMQLTGKLWRSSCNAGYKALWSKSSGFPSTDFFKTLDPRLENVVADKISSPIAVPGALAGGLSESMAKRLGLVPGTAVSVGSIDAHVAVPAVGISSNGKMLMIIGTSTCHMVLDHSFKTMPGVGGVVEDGILPGFVGYEAGQSCVGDHFDWLVKNLVPSSYTTAAAEQGISIHKFLREKARAQKPGAHGLIALDWWNGNRSVLVDNDLSGMMLGMNLQTKVEDIYRALIEATAYGTREIIESFEAAGVPVDELFACGGIASKDDMMMQIYADVCNRSIRISASDQTVAYGAAMNGAMAAGKERGGFDDIAEAAATMPKLREKAFVPQPENVAVYDRLFKEYQILHDYFGRGANDVMKRLKAISQEQR